MTVGILNMNTVGRRTPTATFKPVEMFCVVAINSSNLELSSSTD